MLESTTHSERLVDLLDGVLDGSVALPAFQRDYDWTPSDARAMLATVMMGWPSGSLLLLRGNSTFLELRAFEEGPEPSQEPRYVVLDGQQRLTSLFHALLDRGKYVYAVSAEAAGADTVEELEDCVRSFPREQWNRRLRGREWAEASMIPFYCLKTADSFFGWVDDQRRQGTLLEVAGTDKALNELYQRYLHHLPSYVFPATTIDAREAESDIARIFERVNRTGMQLGTFDLSVAKVFTDTWDLREAWEEATLDAPELAQYLGEDGLAVLQVVALRRLRSVRRSAVLSLDSAELRAAWPGAIEGMRSAIRFARAELGVLRREWLPYDSMLVILAALAWDRPLQADAETLRRWFFSRAFALRFDAAANTRVVEDYELLTRVREGSSLPVPAANGDAIASATRRSNRAISRAILCLLASLKPHDLDGTPLRPLLEGGSTDVVVTYLVGKKTADAAGIPSNLAMSQIFALRGTAEALGAMAPGETQLGGLGWPTEGVGRDQLLPDGEMSELLHHPESLLAQRNTLLREQLESAFGQSVVQGDEAEDAELETSAFRPAALSKEELLDRLRTEYILTHDPVPPGVLAGTEPIPDVWLRTRAEELGVTEIILDRA